ncbi:FecR family protein [Chitinophaga sp. Cy-1792]|uniref:FecR family protein n=1 Tax=Chitinophaga sp. Cy-1792 TaxID=2608339 RepID=UPI0014200696|nr:FecR family protein [Chitinophaga sp. Cy-1792]NIG57401.1 DUF4974 domain-containing protein [Chitinophaga sp. Cy-1792]
MDDLLVKQLLGTATDDEQQRILNWIAASPDNEKYYHHFKLIWEESRHLAATSTVDEDKAWARFQQRVGATVNETKVVDIRPANTSWMRIAATVAILCVMAGAAFLYLNKNSNNDLVRIASTNTTRIDTLPDGSVVTLNKNSSISYAADFAAERHITLEGEAFFDIAKDPSKPFLLKVGDVDVKVLGTSFNVKKDAVSIEVIVETGAVEVNKKHNAVKLEANEKAIVAKDADKPEKISNNSTLYNYYRTHTLICNRTPLRELADKLEEIYNITIIINRPDLRIEEMNTVIDTNMSVDSTFDLLQATSGKFTFINKGDTVILK